jgi:hypothetical protein
MRRNGNDIILLVLYVDDIVIAGSDLKEEVKRVKADFRNEGFGRSTSLPWNDNSQKWSREHKDPPGRVCSHTGKKVPTLPQNSQTTQSKGSNDTGHEADQG